MKKKKKAIDDVEAYKQQAQAGEIRLFFLDEIKLMVLATLTRMWVKVGTQGEIRTKDSGANTARTLVSSATSPYAPSGEREDLTQIFNLQSSILLWVYNSKSRAVGEEMIHG